MKLFDDPNELVTLLPPQDAETTLKAIPPVQVVMLDPWYNKGVGGTRPDYYEWLAHIIRLSADRADHIFVWGFPELIWPVLNDLPKDVTLNTWLTWYFKNCPSVIRGWRSAQMACLHLVKPGATLYMEHFLNEAQQQKLKEKKLRYMPGPPSVIEVSLNIGFVGRKEQTGHPAQKPEKVFEPLYMMTTQPGDLVCDPFCGSGTTGAVCAKLGVRSILGDMSEEYVTLAEKRLEISRKSEVVSRRTRTEKHKSPA